MFTIYFRYNSCWSQFNADVRPNGGQNRSGAEQDSLGAIGDHLVMAILILDSPESKENLSSPVKNVFLSAYFILQCPLVASFLYARLPHSTTITATIYQELCGYSNIIITLNMWFTHILYLKHFLFGGKKRQTKLPQ